MQKNDDKVGVGKMKIKKKHFCFVFLNACSILELILFNRNLTKLVYQNLLGSDCRARAQKLSEHLKKQLNFPSKFGEKGH